MPVIDTRNRCRAHSVPSACLYVTTLDKPLALVHYFEDRLARLVARIYVKPQRVCASSP